MAFGASSQLRLGQKNKALLLPVINGEITKTAETKFSRKIEDIVPEEKENYDRGKKR